MTAEQTICVAAEANEILREFPSQRPVPFTRQLARLGAFLCRPPLRSLVRVYQVRAISFPHAWKGTMSRLKHSHIIIVAITVISMLAVMVALAESKDNTLRAQLQAKNEQITALQEQLSQSQRAAIGQDNSEQLAADKQNLSDALAGIYEYQAPYLGRTMVIDCRSDGTAQTYYYMGYSRENVYDKTMVKWLFAGDDSGIWLNGSPFKISKSTGSISILDKPLVGRQAGHA